MRFYTRIRNIQKRNDSLLCIGLDPDLLRIPRSVRRSRAPLFRFCKEIIDATSDLVCAYKINLAFFEERGAAGYRSLERVRSAIPPDVLAICDAKRGDIGNSAEMYARGILSHLGADAVTVSPYMGADSVLPFLENPEKGAFILTLTSNPGARDFQYLRSRGKPLYLHVLDSAKQWNRKRNCGLVVGATRPPQLKEIRRKAPDMPFLIPGIGAQGGNLRSVVRYGCDDNGRMAVINVGRTILYASSGADFAEKARRAATEVLTRIRQYQKHYF